MTKHELQLVKRECTTILEDRIKEAERDIRRHNKHLKELGEAKTIKEMIAVVKKGH